MASSISQIKQQVNQIGQQANGTVNQLLQLTANIEKNISAVSAAIGGTAQGEDQKMIEAFQQASKSIKDAAGQLKIAADSAKDWAAKV